MFYIYYLTSELDDYNPRYIGYTINLEKRLKEHLKARNFEKSHKSNWIKSLYNKGLNPIIKEVEVVSSIEEALEKEIFYISEYKEKYKLTNSTSGGEISKTFTDHLKNKISNSLKEYFKTNDNWCKGKRYKLSEESRLSMLEKQGDKTGENNNFYGKNHTEESKKKISESKKIHRGYSYEELYELYIIKDMSQKEISEYLKLTRSYVCRLMKKHKLSKKNKI